MSARRRLRVAAVAAAAILLLLVAACVDRPRDPDAPSVLIVGIDGFDWNLVDPLVEEGRMPVLEELSRRGTRADLLTLVPLEKSPVIWTTIATGRLPSAPGRGFLLPAGEAEEDSAPRAYTSWYRTTRAFWNILTEENVSVSVLGWLETWPAEAVNGTMVTDYVKYFLEEGGADADRVVGRTYPESLFEEIEPVVVYPERIPDVDLMRFLGEEAGAEPEADARDGLSALRWIWAGDLTFTEIARRFLRDRPAEVMAVYLRGPDAVCHRFWAERVKREEGDASRGTRLFGETIDRYLIETDRLLGQILEGVDLDRTTLLLISDHGFEGPRRALDGSLRLGIYMHRETGTVLVAGPWAAGEGLRVEGARVQDVLPTLLHALDLPVAEDLDGRVAFPLLGPGGGRNRPVRTIPTYERGERPRPAEAPESPVSEEIRRQIEALGYVE